MSRPNRVVDRFGFHVPIDIREVGKSMIGIAAPRPVISPDQIEPAVGTGFCQWISVKVRGGAGAEAGADGQKINVGIGGVAKPVDGPMAHDPPGNGDVVAHHVAVVDHLGCEDRIG